MPIGDQGRLLDLTARGERARAAATDNARAALAIRVSDERAEASAPLEVLALSATGIPVDFEERLFAPETPSLIGETMWGDRHPPQEARRESWAPSYVAVERSLRGGIPFDPELHEAARRPQTSRRRRRRREPSASRRRPWCSDDPFSACVSRMAGRLVFQARLIVGLQDATKQRDQAFPLALRENLKELRLGALSDLV